MIAFLGFMAAIVLVMLLAADSPAGRALHRQLVERPLEMLANFERHHLVYIVVIGGFALAGGEVFAVLGPEIVAAFALDFAIYVDAVLVTYALSAMAAAKRGGSLLKYTLARSVRRIRPRRKRAARRAARARKPANEDDPAPALLAA